MEAAIIVSYVGILGYVEGKLVGKTLFTKDPRVIAQKLALVEAGQMIPEVVCLVEDLKRKGFTSFAFEDAAAMETVEKKLGVEVVLSKPSPRGMLVRKNIEKFALKAGLFETRGEMRAFAREVAVELTRLRVKRAGEKRDLLVAQTVLIIDDLDKTVNLFMGRIREWYGLHFPELDRIIENQENYAKLVLDLGKKSNFTIEKLEESGLSAKKAGKIMKAVEHSMGAELTALDIEQIRSLSKQVLELRDLRSALQKYANQNVKEVAPNIQALVGSILASRLIALAGGLTNLGKMPASTIQVLGAEKALFRALKTGTRPPKHGVIFQDAVVHDAKKWQRGKTSRALAGKLAIAARADAFSTRFIGDSLKADLTRRVDEIKNRYKHPPLVQDRRKSQMRSKRRRKKSGYRR